MASGGYEWLTMQQAAARFGYRQAESLRRRIRHLRERGLVLDQGDPPPSYGVLKTGGRALITLYWPNPQIMLLRSDAPARLLVAKRGRRASAQKSAK